MRMSNLMRFVIVFIVATIIVCSLLALVGENSAWGEWIALAWWGVMVGAYLSLRPFKRPKRKNRFECECGYDLRETPYRCPECGRWVQQRPWYESA